MIQRIQTLYLIFIVILSSFFFSGNLLTFTDMNEKIYNIKLSGVSGEAFSLINMDNLIAGFRIGLTVLIIILSFTAIFLFKRRKIQLVVTYIVTFLAVVLTGIEVYIIYLVLQLKEISIIPGFKILIPPVIIMLAVLAARGIKHDERLVKSYERLR